MNADSLIFDMDGTLWDNVNSYVRAWNNGLEKTGHNVRVTRDDLLSLMGKEARVMLNAVLPESSESEQDNLFGAVIESYQNLLESMQPIIYPGVLEGLEKLSKKYKLFLLSNCEKDGLVNFMKYTKTAHLITDYMEHGQNLQTKSHNMKLLTERNSLQSTVYVGDTASDSRESGLAGVPFVFVTYGFGYTDEYALRFDSFTELTDYFLSL